jgi:DNA-binding transcriptional LysR family regulator
MIETNLLQTLLSVSKFNSYSKAAEELGVTQSAVSQNIKSLENKLGLSLVTRSGKAMHLTHPAQELVKLAAFQFNQFEKLIDEIKSKEGSMSGKFHVGTLFGIGKSWVASHLLEFAKIYPDLKLKITMDFPEKLLHAFESNQMDCLIIPESLAPEYAESKVLHDEYTVLVFPQNHSTIKLNQQSSLKEILEYPLILFEENDPAFFKWCKKRFRTVPRKIKTKLVINSFRHILEAVYEGNGIAVVPLHVLERSYYRDKVSRLTGNYQVLNTRFCYVTKAEDAQEIKTKKIFEHLIAVAKKFN